MTPDQKISTLLSYTESALKADPNSYFRADWLQSFLNLPTPSASINEPDMEQVIKNDMQLHAANCRSNAELPIHYGTDVSCNCWLDDQVDTRYTIEPLSERSRLHGLKPFASRTDAVLYLIQNTRYTDDHSGLHWSTAYRIEKESTTK